MRFPASALLNLASAFCRLFSVLCLLVGAATTAHADTTVFAGGRVLMPVYVGVHADAQERAAAGELARVLGLMSGLEWPVQTEPEGQSSGIFVGRTEASARVLPELKASRDLLAPQAGEIGPDGIRLRTVGDRLFVEGGTPEATISAVSWLLQRCAGVRWYWPGEIGEVIPRQSEWTLPDLAVVKEPAYVSREISGLVGDAGRVWAERNGLRRRLEYSHNLTRVFTPEVYDAHPEWFGLVKGERRRPQGGRDWHWQPDLAKPEVAAFAAGKAAESLSADPGRASYSLGMNDTVRFDQGVGTQAAVLPLRYFRGKPDYSPLVFGFMNRAVAGLPESLSSRYLGCLAYFWCENVPPFAVDPRVVPYVTTDRTQFYDPAYRAADYALMSRWQRSGVRAYGLWEYADGTAYVVPRVPVATLAEALREGWWRGARGYMGECGPHAGFDAFKIWLLAQLLQDPERSTGELADDFFGGWYGPAAEPMRRFFERCDEVWMAQQGPPWWIKFYQQSDQVLLFPPEVCAELRGLLDAAVRQSRVDGGCVECGGSTPLCCTAETGRLDGPQSAVTGDRYVGNGHGATKVTPYAEDAASSRGVESGVEPPHSIVERIALTSRAFAVTEAAVAYDILRRELLAPAAERLDAAALGERLVALLHAREELEVRVDEATAGPVPAMASANIDWLVRHDPVPRLLLRLGQRDSQAPNAALAVVASAGFDAPKHWKALAAATASERIWGGVSVAYNGNFSTAADSGLEPAFLYPKCGEVPAGWEVRASPTEAGVVALGPLRAGMRPLRIEGAWDTQVIQVLPAEVGTIYVAQALLRGRSSPGNDAALTLAFLDADGALVGEYRSVGVPKGESNWRSYILGDTAPTGAKYVVLGVAVTRQFGGDWAEATGLSLRNCGR